MGSCVGEANNTIRVSLSDSLDTCTVRSAQQFIRYLKGRMLRRVIYLEKSSGMIRRNAIGMTGMT